MPKPEFEVKPGDVFQSVESREGWRGAFVMVSEVKTWGIVGYVHVIKTHDESAKAYIRYKWDDIEYVGKAVLVPQDEAEG